MPVLLCLLAFLAITIDFLCKSNSFFPLYKKKSKKTYQFPRPRDTEDASNWEINGMVIENRPRGSLIRIQIPYIFPWYNYNIIRVRLVDKFFLFYTILLHILFHLFFGEQIYEVCYVEKCETIKTIILV